MYFRVLFTALMLLSVSAVYSQSVGVASTAITPDASSIMEIQSTTKGLLIPRVALTATNAAGPITLPATSLLVYNTATAGAAPINVTPGYYYNAGTPAAPNWVRLLGGRDAWLTTGNYGTAVATNWLGTNDAVDFATRTNNTERMRILSAGNVLINRTTALAATDLVEAQGNVTFPDAINGYTDQANGFGVSGIVNVAAGAGGGIGVYGLSAQNGGAGVYGDGSDNTTGTGGVTAGAAYDGVVGLNTAATGAGLGSGVYGQSAQTGAAGVWGSGTTNTRGVLGTTDNITFAGVHAQNANIDGDALFATNSAAANTGTGSAVFATSRQTGGSTIIGVMQSANYYPNCVLSAYNQSTLNTARGVVATVTQIDGRGVVGYNNATANTGNGIGVMGSTTQGGASAAGVYAGTSHAAGTGLIAINGAAANTNVGDAVYAQTGQSVGFGINAWNINAAGTGVVGAGNDIASTYYLAAGSGGAFTGLYDGAYCSAFDSITNMTSYTQNAAGVFGRARFNRGSNGDFYHFGIYGEYLDNNGTRNGTRSGGVLGYGSNNGSGSWGSLGYLSSATTLYGGYFLTPAAYTAGAGKSPSSPSGEIGFGVEGGFMGGHVYGSEYGLVTAGNRAGMLVEGETYSTGYYAVLNQTDEGDYVPSYATVSTKPTIYASGTGTMNGGTATIVFDQAFSELASSEVPVIVTVTPMGPSHGLYVESASNTEFVVKENGSNEMKTATGTLNFSWIAMATVKNQENPVVPGELQTNEFHSNMNGFMKNESSSTDAQYYLWWDGSTLRYTTPEIPDNGNVMPTKKVMQKSKRDVNVQMDEIVPVSKSVSPSPDINKSVFTKPIQKSTHQ